eukprot:CAMPEP_0196667204 /NCGR_PEP_ID=MMETSP1086-20130531/64951_1 /TAXON_ID=77921 /ORGANISM="Cyanoptyche  gloeocystis , Strain SAG4.97" /LENGTH=68 /DNA_ID=CAMNT_0042004507 /DNA_START=386 /DNA_END=592 /DNA_ORIENTATION=+
MERQRRCEDSNESRRAAWGVYGLGELEQKEGDRDRERGGDVGGLAEDDPEGVAHERRYDVTAHKVPGL